MKYCILNFYSGSNHFLTKIQGAGDINKTKTQRKQRYKANERRKKNNEEKIKMKHRGTKRGRQKQTQ
jgi:hypothetical protein